MKSSANKVLTTHVGSLPRPAAALDFLIRKERGEDYDPAAFDAAIRAAVLEVVRQQAALGIDVVSDGEVSKIGYATYIKDRFSGFGGEYTPKPHLDVRDYPDFRRRMAAFMGPQNFKRLVCTGPVALTDSAAIRTDIENFKAALSAVKVTEGFLNAASPGVIATFLPNQFYPTYEKYIEALSVAVRPEYEAVAKAGLLLQIDCPDLAMARHTTFQEMTQAEFLARAELHVDALNQALVNVPHESVRVHVCWGNYEGPHDWDIPVQAVLPVLQKIKAKAILFEGANPRHEHEWKVWRDAGLKDLILIPGVLDTSSNYVEHPELVADRITRLAEAVGREKVIAGTDCGFGTSAGYGKVDAQIAMKKLKSLVEGAAMASRQLYG